MKTLILVMVLFLTGCADSILGPPSDEVLDYEVHKLKLFEDEYFGMIGSDSIIVQVSEVKEDYFVLSYPIGKTFAIHRTTSGVTIDLVMYDKYSLYFKYDKTNQADIFLQLESMRRIK